MFRFPLFGQVPEISTLTDADTCIGRNLGKKEKAPESAREKKKWLRERGIEKRPKTDKLSVPVHDTTVMLNWARDCPAPILGLCNGFRQVAIDSYCAVSLLC